MLLVAAAAAAVAVQGDFVFTRQVESLYDATGTVLLGPNCPNTDFYGTYNCAFPWGTNVTINYTLAMAEQMNASWSLVLDFKVDKIFNLTAVCPVCGGHCKATVLGITLSFRLPPCPIRAGMQTGTTYLQLPKKIPPPFAVLNYLTGTLSIANPQNTTLDRLFLTADAAPMRTVREVTKTVPGKTSVYVSRHDCVGKPYFTFEANTCTRPPHSAYAYMVACAADGHTVTKYTDNACTDRVQQWESSNPGNGLEKVEVDTTPGDCYNHGRASIAIECNP
jgi:hypothetical protein